jgi:hypothetical protein
MTRPGFEPGRRGGKLATNRLSYGADFTSLHFADPSFNFALFITLLTLFLKLLRYAYDYVEYVKSALAIVEFYWCNPFKNTLPRYYKTCFNINELRMLVQH